MQALVIFISYRRTDTAGHAKNLHDRLRLWFDESALFFDVELESGEVVPNRITDALRAARVVLVLIGPDWLAELNRRAQLPELDYVREEVRLALQRQLEESPPRIIPVLLGGATPIKQLDLDASLRPLADLNAHVLSPDHHWDHAFVAMRTLLAAVPGVPKPHFVHHRASRSHFTPSITA